MSFLTVVTDGERDRQTDTERHVYVLDEIAKWMLGF